MDPHKKTRGLLLGNWVDAHGGATRCLVSAGYDQGTKEFRAREAHLSISRKAGMGHVAALRYEREFESQGMQPGALTNNLDEVVDQVSLRDSHGDVEHNKGALDPLKRPSFPSNESDELRAVFVPTARNRSIIPANPQPAVVVALNWEQLMETILKEGLRALETGLWVEVQDDSMVPEFNPGDMVLLERLEGYTFKAGDRVLVREQGGDVLLREYRAITSKTFDAVPLNPAYGTLHSATHGLEPLAKVTRLTKMYR